MSACPCCQSRKGRPLAITDPGDGRVLLHAFCGCSTESVLGALDLTVSDLFDAPLAAGLSPSMTPTRQRVSAREVMEALSQELTFVALLSASLQEHQFISDGDWRRFAVAASRINSANDYLNGR